MDCQDPRPALPTLSRGTPLYAARTFLYTRVQRSLALHGLAQLYCRVLFVKVASVCTGHLVYKYTA
jgi:hypothetical protein